MRLSKAKTCRRVSPSLQAAREVEIHGALNHPHVIGLYAAFEDEEGVYQAIFVTLQLFLSFLGACLAVETGKLVHTLAS